MANENKVTGYASGAAIATKLNQVGDPTTLKTTAKTTLVGAINEVKDSTTDLEQ